MQEAVKVFQRIRAAWHALWTEEEDMVVDARHALDRVAVRLTAVRNRTSLTWREFLMALADELNSIASAIDANNTTIAATTGAAVSAATGPLNDQITQLTQQNADLTQQLQAAQAAADVLKQKVDAQTAELNPGALTN